jgi:uncharacterized phage protein gp47/JayE
MSFARPSLSQIIERDRDDIEARLPGADSRLRHSLLDVLMRSHGGTAAGLYGYLDFIARQVLPDTAEGEFLSRHASLWGIHRKAATGASGNVTFTGNDGIAIPAGTITARLDGTLYRTTADAVIAGGTVIVPVEAVEGGPEGNAIDQTELTLTSPIAGVQSNTVVAAEGLTEGAVEEDDSSLLSRLLQRIQNPPQGGSSSDYERWALEVEEVTRVWVYPLWLGVGTVGVTFVLDARADIIPLQADLDAVEAHLEQLRPVGAAVNIFAPEPKAIDFKIAANPSTAEVKTAIEEELKDMFARDGAPGKTIYLSRIYEAISVAAGESHHQLHAPLEDVPSDPASLPVLGNIEWVG